MESLTRNRLVKIGKILFIALWVVWLPLQVLTGPIPLQPVKEFYSNLTGIPIDQIAETTRPGDPNSNLNAFDKFSRSPELYSFMTVISGIVIVTGLVFLSKGRALFEKFLLLQVFAIPLERETWGKIFDISNNNPVPFCSVMLMKLDEQGNEKLAMQTVGDLDGRYRLYASLENGKYVVEVKAEGYQAYRKELSQELSANLSLITNIPLVPLDYKPGINLTHSYNTLRNRITNVLIAFIYVAALLPGTITVYNLIFHLGLAAIINAILYGYAVPWNTYVLFRRSIFRPGRIIDASSLQPIGNVTMEIFKDGKHILSTLSDKNGVPKFDLEEGKYSVKVSKQGYATQENFENALQEISINKDGFLRDNISLSQINPNLDIQAKAFINPFA